MTLFTLMLIVVLATVIAAQIAYRMEGELSLSLWAGILTIALAGMVPTILWGLIVVNLLIVEVLLILNKIFDIVDESSNIE